jgi:hypothetical protein
VRQREKGKIARQQKILIEPKETSCWYQALLVSLLYERKESKQAVSQLSETNAKFTARDDNKKLHINSGKEATTVSGTVKLLLLIVDNSIG